MKKKIALALCSILSVCTQAQNMWTATDIADSLKRDAYSVIRDYQTTVTAPSPKTMTVRCHRAVTVLNKKGDGHAAWQCNTSRFEKLTDFSGRVMDAQGKVVKKLKKGDLHATQYSENLATDNQYNYIEPPVMDYPYTVEYDWELTSADGYVEYAYFSPITHARQALQQAQLVLNVPAGTQIRHKGLPMEREPQKQVAGKNDQYVWQISAMRGLIDDEYDDYAMNILPAVLAIPLNFRFGDSEGTLDSWESKGRWYASLAEGRGTLLPADAAKVKELTAGCQNDREKIAALYKYLGDKTRYVSIQLGIGGWQPMSATEVGTTGFGDCKALTNYMQALLREVGIASYQTIISTEYEDLLEGFPNMYQTDHVILTVPQEDGTSLYIECTNPQLPLGYIPDSYAGHEALQVCGKEGRLIRLPGYSPDNSYEKLTAEVHLKADGTSELSFDCDHYGARYGNVRNLMRKSEKERKDIVAHWMELKDPQVTETELTETKEPVPHLDLKARVNVTYGNVNGDKIFIVCNPFRDFSVPRMRKDRRRPIVVDDSYAFMDELKIELPEGYVCKTANQDESKATDFGSYGFTIRQEGRQLTINTSVRINKGRYGIEQKDEFIAFREGISKMMSKVMILEKL